jgi:methyltransferase (TIGR00027 family)
MTGPLVGHVSDTARWVAVYRAWESDRPNALFHDPFARRLAGDRGPAIAATVPRSARTGWPMITRTKLIDDLVMATVGKGYDRVVNLAAGFDTRPYRLPLPPSLSWVEADLPAMIDEKTRLLADATPVCNLSREPVDLVDPGARRAFLARVSVGATRMLVITEGLLGYLSDDVVRSLGGDLAAVPAVHSWILDLFSPVIREMLQKGMGNHLARAPLIFAPSNGVAFFEALGWRPVHVESMLHAAARFHRLPFPLRLFALFPPPDPRNIGTKRWSAVVELER